MRIRANVPLEEFCPTVPPADESSDFRITLPDAAGTVWLLTYGEPDGTLAIELGDEKVVGEIFARWLEQRDFGE